MMKKVFETHLCQFRGSALLQHIRLSVRHVLNLGIFKIPSFHSLFLLSSSDKHHVPFFFFPITTSTCLLICCLHNINLIKLFTTPLLKTCPNKTIYYLIPASLYSLSPQSPLFIASVLILLFVFTLQAMSSYLLA